MIPGMRMPDPKLLTNIQLEDAIASLDKHWDRLIELSAQHGNKSITWLEEYYSQLVDELCRRGLKKRGTLH